MQWGKTPLTSVLDMTQNNLIMMLQPSSFEECEVPFSLPLLSGPLGLGVVEPDRVLSMGQMFYI